MPRLLVLTSLLFLFSAFSFSQSAETNSLQSDTTLQDTKNKIFYTKVLGGYSYYYNGKLISANDVFSLVEKFPENKKYLRRTKNFDFLAMMLSSTGASLLGWYVGVWLAGADPDWKLAAVGGGLTLISIPILRAGNKNLNKAINIYNLENVISHKPTTEISISGQQNGLALVIHF